MTEADARRRAEQYLAIQTHTSMTTGRGVETPRSWIFEARAVSGEVLFGNAPAVVEKRTGAVAPFRPAWREFVDNLTGVERLQRWWSRRRYF